MNNIDIENYKELMKDLERRAKNGETFPDDLFLELNEEDKKDFENETKEEKELRLDAIRRASNKEIFPDNLFENYDSNR